MLKESEYLKAKERQQKLLSILNRFSQEFSGDDKLEMVYKMSFHFQDLGYVLEQLQELSDFWFQENEYAE